MRKLLGLGLCVIFVAGCADERFQLKGSDNVKIPIKMQVKDDAPADVKKLAADVTAGRWVSFKAITKLLVAKHARESEQLKSQKDPGAALNKMLAAITPPNFDGNPRQMKIAYEDLIQKKTGKEIVYNVDDTNVVDFVTTAKMQCYSGTYLYELIRRNRVGSDFEKGREVVIFTPGHVLPGYFETAGQNNLLIGVETTESGGAGSIIDSFTKDYKKARERIIDAQIFALIEIAQDYLTNPAEVVAQAEKITAEKYGFEPMDLGQVAAADSAPGAGQVSAKKVLNASILGFGHADVPPNDQKRAISNDKDGKLDIAAPYRQSTGAAVAAVVDGDAYTLGHAKDVLLVIDRGFVPSPALGKTDFNYAIFTISHAYLNHLNLLNPEAREMAILDVARDGKAKASCESVNNGSSMRCSGGMELRFESLAESKEIDSSSRTRNFALSLTRAMDPRSRVRYDVLLVMPSGPVL